jgi:SAM-dependent methyltransferase
LTAATEGAGNETRQTGGQTGSQTGRPTLGVEYFDGKYAASADPWGFRSRWYERRKYAISVAMLPSARYGCAFELGCSIGELTAMLAPRCDALLSCDVSAAAVAAAARRTAAFPQVRVERRPVPASWPAGTGRFDLVVCSEMLYYLGDDDLGRTLDLATAALEPGGTLLAVHWRHPVASYPRTGDEVHEAIAARPELTLTADHREPDFLAQVYLAVPAGTEPASVSVAAAEGLT